MNLSSILENRPWLVWGCGIVVAFPVLTLLLSELQQRLVKRGHPLSEIIRWLRTAVLPAVILLLLVNNVLQMDAGSTTHRVVQSLTFGAAWMLALVTLLTLLFQTAPADSWRGRVPRLFIDLTRTVGAIIGFAFIYSAVWGHDLQGFFAALGLGSLVVGLALQDTLGSFFAGITLLFEKPFRLGDRVIISGKEGVVEQITWRSTHLRLSQGNTTLVIPNIILAKEAVENLSRPQSQLERIVLGFSYDDPPNKIKALISGVLAGLPDLVQNDPMNGAVVQRYAASTVEYEVAFLIADHTKRRRVRDIFMTRLWYAMRREGISLPYPISVQQEKPSSTPTNGDVSPQEMLEALQEGGTLAPEAATASILRNAGKLMEYAQGEYILQPQNEAEAAYLVLSGRVQLRLSGKRGGLLPVKQGRGTLFGLAAILHGPGLTAEVTAETDVRLLCFPRAVLLELLTTYPLLARELGEHVEQFRRTATAVPGTGG